MSVGMTSLMQEDRGGDTWASFMVKENPDLC